MTDTKTAHTPGPWRIYDVDPTNVWTADEDNDFPVAMVPQAHPQHELFKEAVANARLIAAAPELLEAVQLALSTFEGCECACEQPSPEDPDGYTCVPCRLKATIAKAEGR